MSKIDWGAVVGVIEWGSARDDWDPTLILAVGTDEGAAELEVRREAARVTWNAVQNDPADWAGGQHAGGTKSSDSMSLVADWSEARFK